MKFFLVNTDEIGTHRIHVQIYKNKYVNTLRYIIKYQQYTVMSKKNFEATQIITENKKN